MVPASAPDYVMPDVYYYLRNVLEPLEQRLRASFDLQLAIADTLNSLADEIEQTEQRIANGFGDPGTTPTTSGHGGGSSVH